MSDFCLQALLMDGFFAAIAAVGFAVISNPPRKSILVCALLSAIGHALRFGLVNYTPMGLVVSTGLAAFSIGLMSIFFARRIHCPAEVFCFPSLLPMIPGMFAYRAILSLINISQSSDDATTHESIISFFDNGVKTVCVLLALVVGLTLSICREKSFMLTRVRDKGQLSPTDVTDAPKADVSV
ncbi:MAG: threonine/serine exporter family protein [Akkermansia sp.]